MENNVGIYTEEESNKLAKYSRLRDQMVDVMFKGGIPEDNRDIRLANELLMAGEKSIHDTAANRTKHQDAMAKDAILETVAEALKSVALGKEIISENRVLDIPNEYVPVDIVPGELEINPEPLNPTDFLEDEGE